MKHLIFALILLKFLFERMNIARFHELSPLMAPWMIFSTFKSTIQFFKFIKKGLSNSFSYFFQINLCWGLNKLEYSVQKSYIIDPVVAQEMGFFKAIILWLGLYLFLCLAFNHERNKLVLVLMDKTADRSNHSCITALRKAIAIVVIDLSQRNYWSSVPLNWWW